MWIREIPWISNRPSLPQWSTICYRLLDACWFPRTPGTSWDHNLFTCHPTSFQRCKEATSIDLWSPPWQVSKLRLVGAVFPRAYIPGSMTSWPVDWYKRVHNIHTTYLYHKISSTGTYCRYYRSDKKKSDIFWYAKRKIHRKLNHHYCHILPLLQLLNPYFMTILDQDITRPSRDTRHAVGRWWSPASWDPEKSAAKGPSGP